MIKELAVCHAAVDAMQVAREAEVNIVNPRDA